MSRRVLIVDDDPAIRTSISEALAEENLEVTVAGDGAQALAMLARTNPDVILTDVRMPEIDGLSLLRLIKERGHDADIILMTAFDDMATVVAAMRHGAVEFLVKPVDVLELRALVHRALDDRRARIRAKQDAPAPLAPE